MFYNEPQKTLIVVSKDEIMINLLKKYVETNDDKDEENIVGTKDGTVNIVAWNEKVWLDNKKAGNINNKVLFIGDVKGIKKLLPIIDVKYNEFGIKYGWAGNQAILVTDPKAFTNEEEYNAFFEELQKIQVSDDYKKKIEIGKKKKKEEKDNTEDTQDDIQDNTQEDTQDSSEQIQNTEDKTLEDNKNIIMKYGRRAMFVLDPLGSGLLSIAQHNVKGFKNKKVIKKQQYFYGITKLYENDLAKFLE